MKTTHEIIAKFKEDFETELYHYYLSEQEVETQIYYATSSTYERVLRDLGVSKKEIEALSEKIRSNFANHQQLPTY